MARYFFNIYGRPLHRDALGEELQNDAAAWSAAIRLAPDIEDGLQSGHTWRLANAERPSNAAGPFLLNTWT